MDAIRGPDAGTLLIRALRGHAAAASLTMHVELIACMPWASATFVGTLHRLTIAAMPVPGLRDWIDGLPEAEFAMRGHIVADLVVDRIESIGDREHVTIAVLTLIDA
ncbi:MULTISPECIES: hypothetical protein [unclassified Sphingomonas]|uniref:hypothetical protein n=1 Tax=unclassified Sphingomonas TaxID=196159 RepID=UPI000701C19A|nr:MULTISPECIES: hypothetical protein [unclassified Sphingomonas]KQS47002.1 hypothetical protein ASG20_17345 [Sphingomonas sp. Leaf198]